MFGPAVVIPAPAEPEGLDLTGWAIGVFFPAALIWSVAMLVGCLFANGWL